MFAFLEDVSPAWRQLWHFFLNTLYVLFNWIPYQTFTIKVAELLWLKCYSLHVWTLLDKWWCVRQQNTCIAAFIVSSTSFFWGNEQYLQRGRMRRYIQTAAHSRCCDHFRQSSRKIIPVRTRKILNVFSERYNEIHGCAHTLILKERESAGCMRNG